MSEDIEVIEKNIFHQNDASILSKISLMNRNVIEFRKMMKTHRFVLDKLRNRKSDYLTFPQSRACYGELLEYFENIWDILEALKETSETLVNTSHALITHRLNEVTRIISVFSAIVLPATLVAFLFGAGVGGKPFQTSSWGFWIVMGLMMLASLIVAAIFKKKKWF